MLINDAYFVFRRCKAYKDSKSHMKQRFLVGFRILFTFWGDQQDFEWIYWRIP